MLSYFLLFAVGLISGCFVFFKKNGQKYVDSLLSFSGAYLLSVTFLHLLPELFVDYNYSIGIYLLIGFFLQLLLDYFSGGIEHGHAHVNHKEIGKFPYLIFLSLCLHALIEAFPIHQLNADSYVGPYLIGLLMHKAPISFVLATLLLGYKLNKRNIFIGILIFSCMGPLGAWIGGTINSDALLFKQLLEVGS